MTDTTPTKPKKKKTAAPAAETYTHREATALVRPDIGLQTQFKKKKEPAKYAYDPTIDPQLEWAGKAERTSFEVPTLPLFVHERLSTEAILATLKGHKRDKQMSFDLYGDSQLPIADQLLRAYEHKDKWTNRTLSTTRIRPSKINSLSLDILSRESLLVRVRLLVARRRLEWFFTPLPSTYLSAG